MPMQMKIRFCLTALLAGCGGWLAQQANIPLAWLIGSLLVTMLLGLRFPITVPRKLYRSGQIIVGTAVGLSVPPEVVDRIGPHVPTILAGALISIAVGRLLAPVVARAGKLDLRTAFFAMVPAGISEMADLAARHGADAGAVALFHTLRVCFIVLLLPTLIVSLSATTLDLHSSDGSWDRYLLIALLTGLAAAYAGNRLGLPSAFVVAPMIALALLSASGVLAAREPAILLAVAQIALGLSLGARFRADTLKRLPRALAGGIPIILLHGALMLGLAVLAAEMTGLALPELLMGFATGGTAEMVLTAQIVAADAALVAAYQVTRGLLGNLLAGPLYRWTILPRLPKDKG